MAKIVDKPTTRREFACIYGYSGAHKTTLGAHLPTDCTWAGRIVHIAADLTSRSMHSITPADRDRFINVIPDGNVRRDDRGNLLTNWKDEAFELAQTDWKAKYPDASAILWDTVTWTADRFMAEITKLLSHHDSTGKMKSKGSPAPRDDIERKVTKEEINHWNMAQKQTVLMLEWLKICNPELHIICTFQKCLSPPDPTKGYGLLLGPATVGTKGPWQIPQLFDTVLWLSVDEAKGHRTRIVMKPTSNHIAKVQCPRPTDVPVERVLGPDPSEAREFWNWLEGLKA